MADGIKGYGRSRIYRENANWEVMRSRHFELLIMGLNDEKVGNGATLNDIWLYKQDQLIYPNANGNEKAKFNFRDKPEECFRLAVQKAFIPSNKVDTASIVHGNETVKVATAFSVEGGNITCLDAVSANIERLCWAWFNQVINVDTMLMGLVVDYKKLTKLLLYSPDGSVCRYWNCYGTFPTSMSSDEPSYDSADLRTIQMDLEVDLAIPGIKDQDEIDAFATRILDDGAQTGT